MENNKVQQSGFKDPKELALHYMCTLVDVARESFLILDSDLRVITANPIFYQIFRVSPEQTKDHLLYDLGNGQWNIPELKKLLQEILPQKKEVKNYEVRHIFEDIGERIMQLNAKQIDSLQLIVLAIEDITTRKRLEKRLVRTNKELEVKVADRTRELNNQIKELEALNKTMVGRELKMVELKQEIEKLKKQIKNGNGFDKLTTSGRNGNGKNGYGNNKNGGQK